MKTGKILVALQTYSGDLAQADALARLVTDITLHSNAGQHSPHADFMLCVRWDTEIPMATARYCQKAFANVHLFRTRARVVGWPAGPNAMAVEAFNFYLGKQRDKVWRYSGLFLAEPDSTPLSIDCLARIHREWSTTAKPVLGDFVGAFPGGVEWSGTEHVNGNMLISHTFADQHPLVLSFVPSIAWDAHWRREFRSVAQASLCLHSNYRMGSENNPWDGDCERLWKPVCHTGSHPLAGVQHNPCWLHGVKSEAAIQCVRDRLRPLVAYDCC